MNTIHNLYTVSDKYLMYFTIVNAVKAVPKIFAYYASAFRNVSLPKRIYSQEMLITYKNKDMDRDSFSNTHPDWGTPRHKLQSRLLI